MNVMLKCQLYYPNKPCDKVPRSFWFRMIQTFKKAIKGLLGNQNKLMDGATATAEVLDVETSYDSFSVISFKNLPKKFPIKDT